MLAFLASLLSLSLPSSNYLWRKMRDIEKDGKHILRTAQGYHRTHIPLGCPHTCSLLSHFSRVRLCATHRWQPTRLHHPWDSPGKNPGVGCHFLLPCMKVKSESEVALSCPTLRNPMDGSPPGSSVHGIFQARVLEWVAIAFSDYIACCCCCYVASVVSNSVRPHRLHQAPPSLGFSRQEPWSGLPFPSPMHESEN